MMRVKVAPLNNWQLGQIAAQVRARQDHKRRLLSKMVSYAETNSCRRRVILDYFGDQGPADADVSSRIARRIGMVRDETSQLCCDNDLARAEARTQTANVRAAETESEQIALTVFEAVHAFQRKLGKGKLADVLKGSRAKGIESFTKSPYYGKLAGARKTDLEAVFNQLLQDGYIQQVGSEYPTLQLTPRGESALNTRAAIGVNIQPIQPGVNERARAEKEAGGTVLLTLQLLQHGLTPEQIAAQRGLALSTIYSHLAQLITQDHVNINAVVPQPLQNQIRTAIEQVGSAQYLAPIKARLPQEIDYNVIRCVANAWLREHGQTPPTTTKPPTPVSTEPEDPTLFEKLRAWRLEQARNERIAPFMIFSDAVLHELAAQKPQTLPQFIAIKGIGPNKAEKYGAPVLALIAQFKASSPATSESIDTFLARPHSRNLYGPWRAGYALDFHSRFDGDTHNRSVIGDLAFRYKYRGEQALAHDLAARWAQLLREHPELPKPEAVIPVPPSTPRDLDPVSTLAAVLASQLKIPVLTNALVKTRATRPQKEMHSLAQKQANVRGAFALQGAIQGKHILLVDDLFDSGATLQEAARVLQRGGAASLIALTLTKTIHADQ